MNNGQKHVFILGDGGWGTALACTLARNNHQVTVWGPFPEYTQQVESARENIDFLPGISLPSPIHFTSATDAVSSADMLVIASPSRYYRNVLPHLSSRSPEATVVSVSKGFDPDTRELLSELAAEELSCPGIVVLSGPSHAEEVAKGIPSALTAASADTQHAQRVQEMFSSETFRVYTSTDRRGVELGGALKNVIAVAAGISDGIGFGDNTKAALITRGLAEITRLGAALGADPKTFSGLSGIGDLIVTCASRHSRNRSVGERLGRGETLEDIQRSMKQIAEGVWNCRAAQELAGEHDIAVPIINEVVAIIHEQKDPTSAVRDLMTRDLRSE